MLILTTFDDEEYVLRNAHVRSGLTFANAAWAVTATGAANWHPVTWISHMADVSLFGMAPAGCCCARRSCPPAPTPRTPQLRR